MKNIDVKKEKYIKLAQKKPQYYCKLGDLYFDEADFKNAEKYYKLAIKNKVLAFQQLGYTYEYQHQYKKAFDIYMQGVNNNDVDCIVYVAYCYEVGHWVKEDEQKAIEYYTKASDLGSARASRSLGDIYGYDLTTPDFDKALKFYERAFYLGDLEIAKKIGFIYLNEEKYFNVKKAVEWYEKGLSLGESTLNFDMAYLYLNDRFIPHDYEKGLFYLANGVKFNDPHCLYLQARIYEMGLYGVSADNAKYIHFVKRAAKLGQDDALLDLGYYYFEKNDYDKALDCFAECELDDARLYWSIAIICETKKQDYKNALRYYQLSMEMGYPEAIERMAEAYLGDELGLEKDEQMALKLFNKAAKLGDSSAQYNLGMGYACGYYGLTANREIAIYWLKKSAKRQNPMACIQMGLYYFYTVKTKSAYKKALELFTNAHNLGEEEAIINIGLCYLQGKGAKENKKAAVKCFKTAVKNCNSGVAYYNLGICYENGFGVKQDYKKAIEMYGKAVENGESAGLAAIKNVYILMNKKDK